MQFHESNNPSHIHAITPVKSGFTGYNHPARNSFYLHTVIDAQ